MIVEKIQYDPKRDVKPVEPFGFIDLKSALVNNVVPSQVAESDTDYNGIEDPSSIVGKPSDVFDALSMQNAISESGSGEDKSDS